MNHINIKNRLIAFAGVTLLAAGVVYAGGLGDLIKKGAGLGGGGSKTSGLEKVGDTIQAGAEWLSTETMSSTEIEAIGQSAALNISSQSGINDSDALNAYVMKVGLVVASHSPRQEIPFTFGVINSDDVNAYSTPGGYVFVTRGALKLMDDESELAGVLGHEIGHISKDHGLEAIKTKGRLRAMGKVASVNSDAQWVQSFGPMVEDLGNIVYSEKQELEADKEGMKYLIAAGYDPHGFLKFLGKMNQVAKGDKILQSHPRTKDRIRALEDEAKGGTGQTLADRFKENVKLN